MMKNKCKKEMRYNKGAMMKYKRRRTMMRSMKPK